MIHDTRIRHLNERDPQRGPVLCWLERDHRAQDNWALLHARELATTLEQPLAVVLAPYRERVGGNRRQAAFLVDGWRRWAAELERLNIPLYILLGDITVALPKLVNRLGAGCVVVDQSPLKPAGRRVSQVAEVLPVALHQVDAHNVVPVWTASDKQEFAARTMRPKINRLLGMYLTEFPTLGRQQRPWPETVESPDWDRVAAFMAADFDALAGTEFQAGSEAALAALDRFLEHRLARYSDSRNDPNAGSVSDLSPYINAGHVAAQRIALTAQRYDKDMASQEAFLEELVVRRELSENFCYYNDSYDSPDGFPDWATKTLRDHQSDPRDFLYSQAQWEAADTHDDIWNACQRELLGTGKLHGYMRMYWAKKLLEWSATPADAFAAGMYHNDTYALDGNDPNGFVGVAWSIGGLHDRPWTEREVYGKVRYMNANGCRRKFDVDRYIRRHSSNQPELFK